MSKEFVQLYVPHKKMSKTDIQDWISKNGDIRSDNRKTNLIEVPSDIKFLLHLPEYNYNKNIQYIMECCMNLFQTCTQDLSNNMKTREKPFITEDGYEDSFNVFIKYLGSFMQYFSNSYSWIEKRGMLVDDKIDDKLQMLIQMLNRSQEVQNEK